MNPNPIIMNYRGIIVKDKKNEDPTCFLNLKIMISNI